MDKIAQIVKILDHADTIGLNAEVDSFDVKLAQILDNGGMQQQQIMMLLQQMQVLNREIVNLKNTMMEMQRHYNSGGMVIGQPKRVSMTS